MSIDKDDIPKYEASASQKALAHTQLIKKELETADKWKRTYGQELLKLERQMLLEALREERDQLIKSKKIGKEKALLYDGVSKEGKGRYAYLKHQNQKSPIEKYSFPQTSSMEVGWRVALNQQHAEHERRRI